jgi:hypothetical protein
MTTKICNTDTFVRLAKKGNVIVADLDPDGTHVCSFSMVHNDVEYRTQWLVKVQGSMTPVEVFLDMSFEDFDKLVDYDDVAAES